MNYKNILCAIPLGILCGMTITSVTLEPFKSDHDMPIAVLGGLIGIVLFFRLAIQSYPVKNKTA